jgi:hypothetical protein
MSFPQKEKPMDVMAYAHWLQATLEKVRVEMGNSEHGGDGRASPELEEECGFEEPKTLNELHAYLVAEIDKLVAAADSLYQLQQSLKPKKSSIPAPSPYSTS